MICVLSEEFFFKRKADRVIDRKMKLLYLISLGFGNDYRHVGKPLQYSAVPAGEYHDRTALCLCGDRSGLKILCVSGGADPYKHVAFFRKPVKLLSRAKLRKNIV